jgi:two-component system, OmpR family, sensor histidine kinase KdpD
MAEQQKRPDPDELLKQLKVGEGQGNRGRLKIFLGYAPGVGKTYSMLEAARVRQKDTDVVIGIAETHGRADTEALLQGFEVIPRRQLEYRGIKITEMDIDAILKRHPWLVLVDELAHNNAPGSRHPKRYQDVEELLEAGVDVYTTLNIQHIESGRNAVAQITGIWVRETVPDSFIDNAAEVETVDLPPVELIQRLKEGKVYIPEQIAPATESFFRQGNLIALRELALRTASKHVDSQTLEYMKTHGITGPWPSTERILVCVSSSPIGTRVIRSARRLAHQLGAEWFAINIETPDTRLTSSRQERINSNLKLAERMGATVDTVPGNSIVNAVVDFATKNNITKIVVGKSQKFHWRDIYPGSIASQLIRHNQNYDVFVVSGRSETIPASQVEASEKKEKRNWLSYVYGMGLVAVASLIGQLMHSSFTPTTIAMVYLLCVIITAYFWGLGPSILVSVLSVLAFDYFHVPPYLTFRVADTQYIFTFVSLLAVGVIISYLTMRVRRQTESVVRKEHQTAALYTLGKDLAVSNDLDTYLKAIIKRASDIFGYDTAIFLPDSGEKNTLKPITNTTNSIDENEIAAAVWAFQHQKIVGHGTDTLPNAGARYLPMITARGTVGVLALFKTSDKLELSIDQERLLEAYTDLAAVALESIHLSNELQKTRVLRETEKLQTALLNSVSHDLRTPLVSIIGVLSSLQQEGIYLDDTARMNLIQVARGEADKLNHLIANLLDVSRIEAGAIKIVRQPSDVQELVSAALEQLGNRIKFRNIDMNIPNNLPFVTVDFSLIEQALVNVLENAVKYSIEDSPIDIRATQEKNHIAIEISDRGVGIPVQELSHVFDKFYRVQRPGNVAGTGLGLFISKSFIEANGGSIKAINQQGGGTIIRIFLPVIGIDTGEQKKHHAE